MPSIIPITTTINPDFEEVVNYNLHFDHVHFKLAQKFIQGQIAANPYMSRPELKELIKKNTTMFMLSVKQILDELFKE